ncbi:hypothetical protein AAFF_G00199170 [Aldrovandia affinis]|uniref:Uncharacterized protein n=1 Tax=Aldrovandia affinis TaxID=143900 RepID=A0AAD7RL24_9TELE|nr:hypothetical protein AAFF_G00199170 [Aldrovandia affinis]
MGRTPPKSNCPPLPANHGDPAGRRFGDIPGWTGAGFTLLHTTRVILGALASGRASGARREVSGRGPCAWAQGEEEGEGRMSPREGRSASGSPDRPGTDKSARRHSDALLCSTHQSRDGALPSKPIRGQASPGSSQKGRTVTYERRPGGGSVEQATSSPAHQDLQESSAEGKEEEEEEEEEDETPLNLSTKDRTWKDCAMDLRTSRGRSPDREETQQGAPLNLSLRETRSGTLGSGRKRTAAFPH